MLKQLFAFLLIPAFSYAGQITGVIATPTGGPQKNLTIQFSLNAPNTLAGSFAASTSPVLCYTDGFGNVVGVPNPLVPPSLSQNVASGTLPAGTYFVKLTYVGAGGESFPGPEGSFALTATGTLIVAAPTLQPAAATGYNVYIATSSGAETKQASVTGFTSYSQSAPLVSGAALPASNTSICSITFNDSYLSQPNWYTVSITSPTGQTISGISRTGKVYFAGGPNGTVNISQGLPDFNGQGIYPTPVLSQPAAGAQQTINGALSLGSNSLAVGAITASGPLSANCKNLAGIRCVDVNNVAGWAGSDIGAWINSAIADLGCSSGGYIFVAAGQASFATTINANNCINIKIIGSANVEGGAFACCALTYTGTGSVVTAIGSAGFELSHFYFVWNNASFAGPVVALGGPSSGPQTSYADIDHNLFNGVSPAAKVPILLDLQNTIDSRIDFNFFNYYQVAIRGNASTSTCCPDAITVSNNFFSTATGTAVTAHIQNPGSAMRVMNNTFEMGTAFGTPAVIQCTASNLPVTGFDFGGNWIGDTGAGTWTFFTGCAIQGWDMHGNFIGGSPNITFLNAPSGVTNSGLTVVGNSFQDFNALFTGTNNITSLLVGPNQEISIGNVFDFVPIVGVTIDASFAGTAIFGAFQFFDTGPSLTEISSAPSGCLFYGAECLWGDSNTHALKASYNNDGGFPVTRTIASGTASMTTAAITAGACGTTVTAAAANVATTDTISVTGNGSVAGSAPNGFLVLNAWPTAGNVNFDYCNASASSQTPSSLTVNWKVFR